MVTKSQRGTTLRKTEFTLQISILTVGMAMTIQGAAHAPVLFTGTICLDMISLTTDITVLGNTGSRG